MSYSFDFTPVEAQVTAVAVAEYFSGQGYRVKTEEPVVDGTDEGPVRPTVTAHLGDLKVLVEAQGTPDYTPELSLLAQWLNAHRFYGKFFLATSVSSEKSLSLKSFSRMKKDGVGLLMVEEDGSVAVASPARNPRLVVSLPTGLAFGDAKENVTEILEDYNAGNRLAACRAMAELVEGQIDKLALKASKKQILVIPEQAIMGMDQSNQIDLLASPNRFAAGATPLLDQNLKNDLHSFRGARNLFDHKVRGRRQEQRREQQFPERLVSGARLVSELATLRRRC